MSALLSERLKEICWLSEAEARLALPSTYFGYRSAQAAQGAMVLLNVQKKPAG